jgi:hypothetical protein
MNKLAYLKRGKNLLRSVKRQREYLLKHNKGYIETKWARQELKTIDGALGTIVSSDQMRKFLERKESIIRFLIPSTNHRKQNELNELLN